MIDIKDLVKNGECDTKVLAFALSETRKVDFLKSEDELGMYAAALISAGVWGKEIDRKNKQIKKGGIR